MAKTRNYPALFNIFLFILTLILTLLIPTHPKFWEGFADVRDYLHQSTLPIFSKDFFFASAPQSYTYGLFPRPFTIPLFYKLAGSSPMTIVILQKILHSLSSLYLVYALMLFTEKKRGKYFLAISIYFLMSWWIIVGWTIQLLSESISMSLLFFWIASFLVLIKYRTGWSLIIHIFIAFLFSFTRDSWPYIILAFYLLCLIYSLTWDRLFLRKNIILIIFILITGGIQYYSAKVGEREKYPIANSIIVRIIPHEDYSKWFEQHGMPLAKMLHYNFNDYDPVQDNSSRVWGTYTDLNYKPFYDWINKDGRSVYTQFLVTHPSYTLLFNEPLKKLKRIFNRDINYAGPPNEYSIPAQIIFPVFSPILTLILCIILVIMAIKARNPVLLLPFMMVVVFILQIFLVYNADALEVERHLFITTIMTELIGLWSLGWMLDKVSIAKR